MLVAYSPLSQQILQAVPTAVANTKAANHKNTKKELEASVIKAMADIEAALELHQQQEKKISNHAMRAKNWKDKAESACQGKKDDLSSKQIEKRTRFPC